MLQNKLRSLAGKYQVSLSFFHGRGGSVARGRYPLIKAKQLDQIDSWKVQNNNQQIRITEQGEMIYNRFNTPDLTQYTLSSQLTDLVCELMSDKTEQINSQAYKQLSRLAEHSEAYYRNYVQLPGFFDYFTHLTPVELLDDLHIGSRPCKKAGGLRI